LFNRLLDEILSSAGERCVEAQPAMEVSVRFSLLLLCSAASGKKTVPLTCSLLPHQVIESICQHKLKTSSLA
jgi:hypothetical protein